MHVINEPFCPRRKRLDWGFIAFYLTYGLWFVGCVAIPAARRFGVLPW